MRNIISWTVVPTNWLFHLICKTAIFEDTRKCYQLYFNLLLTTNSAKPQNWQKLNLSKLEPLSYYNVSETDQIIHKLIFYFITYTHSPTQYGSFRNLLPLRFYVKSILALLGPQKYQLWHFQLLRIFNYLQKRQILTL